jgi:hypothetical protein
MREEVRGPTLEIAVAWCFVYLMSDELGISAIS